MNISNINKTDHATRVSIALPEGVELVGADDSVQLQGSILIWDPKLSRNKLSASLSLRF